MSRIGNQEMREGEEDRRGEQEGKAGAGEEWRIEGRRGGQKRRAG